MTGIILAGGKALRMGGIDKAFLKIDNEPIIKGQIKKLRKIVKEIMIVTNSVNRYKDLKGVKVISDVLPGRGPLGGIYSGLLASSSVYNFIIACDMPFLNESLIRYMTEKRHDYDVLVPKIDGKVHPLFGIYSKNCVGAIKESIEGGELRIRKIFPIVRSRFLSRAEIAKFDKGLFSLENINTKDDLSKAEGMAGDL